MIFFNSRNDTSIKKLILIGELMKQLLIILTMVLSTSAFADQCAYVSKAEAQKALTIVLDAEELQSFCEPCGELRATTTVVKSIGISDVNYDNYWELQVNGVGVDLAYTYVNGVNLSKLVGCYSDGVSTSIRKD